jgi:hypothetical protein
MLNRLHLAMTFAALGMVAACTSDSDPAAPSGDAGVQNSGGSSNNGGDGDASDGGTSSNGGEANAAGDSDADTLPSDDDAGDASSDAGESDGGGVDVTPGGAEGLYVTIDGTDHAYTSAGATFVSTSELGLSSNGEPGESIIISLETNGVDPIAPGTYDCASGAASIQYNPPGPIRLHVADNQSGQCTVELISVGAGAGDHITGTFTATVEQASGVIADAGPDLLAFTNGSFDLVR